VSSSGATSRSTTFSNDPFDCLDEFAISKQQPTAVAPAANIHANIRNIKPMIQPKPVSIGSASFYASTSTIGVALQQQQQQQQPAVIDDTLSNGKNLIKPQAVSMPTIIKPHSKAKSPNHLPSLSLKSLAPLAPKPTSHDSFDDDCPSPPMPSVPPPPPPVLDDAGDEEEEDQEKSSYGIALFDYESEVTEDLNFRVSSFVLINCDCY